MALQLLIWLDLPLLAYGLTHSGLLLLVLDLVHIKAFMLPKIFLHPSFVMLAFGMA
jgi:hypothetical protein